MAAAPAGLEPSAVFLSKACRPVDQLSDSPTSLTLYAIGHRLSAEVSVDSTETNCYVANSSSTILTNARQIFRLEGSMPALKNDKFKDYTRYAEHCLNMVASTRDQELRCIQREMAAEWLRLADVVRRPRRSKQMQMG
jgi:hypothetical protein